MKKINDEPNYLDVVSDDLAYLNTDIREGFYLAKPSSRALYARLVRSLSLSVS